jgi:hypothetical protein
MHLRCRANTRAMLIDEFQHVPELPDAIKARAEPHEQGRIGLHRIARGQIVQVHDLTTSRLGQALQQS